MPAIAVLLLADFVGKLGGSTLGVIQGGTPENVRLSVTVQSHYRSEFQAAR